MASKRSLPDEQNARIRARVAEIHGRFGTHEKTAKALGVSRTLVTQHLLGKGAGHVLIEALLRYTGETYEQLVRGVDVAAPTRAPEQWTDLDDRYPNLAEAIRRRQGVLAEAIEEAKGLAMQRDSDADVGEWTEELADIEAAVRRRLRGKAPVPPRDGADEIDVGGDVDTSWRKKK